MTLTKEDKLLLDCLTFDQDSISRLQKLVPSEWASLVRQSQKHLLSSYLYQRLKRLKGKIDIPAHIIKRLHHIYIHCTARNIKIFYELSNALQSLENSGIPFILLKGAHLSGIVYEDAGLRIMEDVDILFKKEDLKKAQECLLNAGYLEQNNLLSLDVHWYIEQYLDLDMEKVWEMASPTVIAGVNALTLSPEHLIVHLCMHLSFHHHFQFAGLRTFCDIRETIRYFQSQINWGKVHSYSEEWGVKNGVFLTLLLARDLVRAQVPDDVLKELKPEEFNSEHKGWAIKQLFQKKKNDPSLSPYFWKIWRTDSFLKKWFLFFKLIIPSKEFLSQKYPSSINTKYRVYYYMARIVAHFRRYLSVSWRIVTREESTMRLVREKNHTFTMIEWISSNTRLP